jgi:NAD(P)-dependent dehydrogenase (short-subunit alcohol dehydrogenase family)
MEPIGPSVVITGGAGALGRAVVHAFLQAEAWVTVADVASAHADLTQFIAASGADVARLSIFDVNLTDETETAKLSRRVLDSRGAIDVWINIVGGYAGGDFVAETPFAEVERMLNLNFRTAYLGCQAALRAMLPRQTGRIVNVASKGALRGAAGHAGYAAAKSAVMRLTETLAEETLTSGVNVNAVLPSMIDTPANRAAMPDADRTHWVSPDDVAQVMLFLASPAAWCVNGACIPVGRG